MPARSTTLALILLCGAAGARADGPKDNLPGAVRPIPPVGISVDDADRKALSAALDALNESIGRLAKKKDAATQERLPDVQVFARAVELALKDQLFFNVKEIDKAKQLLKEGRRRADQLSDGQAPWLEETGLVVRGYVSKIDGSVQPYGLVIPDSYAPESRPGFRLDVWFHGRGETLSEVNFLSERMAQRGQFTPRDTIVLHPYGRYCNAFKFAGEVDVLEAIEAVRRQYRVDDDRISVRGFSMGGAACWQFAVHYSDRWFAAAPGAGFAETARFLQVFQKESVQPTGYEKALWHLYDCTDYAANLHQCPTIAYSGADDAQKQAADVMAEALEKVGIDLLHILGPNTKHAYHPEAKREIDRRMDLLARRGREETPAEVTLVTYTLKYNRMNWVTIDALGAHWRRARVHATLSPGTATVETENVAALTLELPPGGYGFDIAQPVKVVIDGTIVAGPKALSDRSWRCPLRREGKTWVVGAPEPKALAKRHDLQGPIDDAFMDSFLFVRPTGTSANPAFHEWAETERERAVVQWRKQFRGDARVQDDTAVSEADLASSNLVLWGDPDSNAVLKSIADRLPIAWNSSRIKVGAREFPSARHGLILIAPNPLNPARYVVLNSGFTYREYDYLNNARQVPKLPDWAVIDLHTPPDARRPGAVVAADFFGEDWRPKD